jgi:ribosome recycling factor
MDIVDRLQVWADRSIDKNAGFPEAMQEDLRKILVEAIDEIEKLRKLEERIEDLTRTIKANIEHANDLIKKYAPC